MYGEMASSRANNQVESDHLRTRGRGPLNSGVLEGRCARRLWTEVW